MSDAAQAKETVKPDSQKSTIETISENVTDAGDKAIGAIQPSDSKSSTQKASDETRGPVNDASKTAKSYAGQAADTLNDATKKAGDAVKSYTETADKKAGECTGNTQQHGKTVLQQAQEAAGNVLDGAAKATQDLANTLAGSNKN